MRSQNNSRKNQEEIVNLVLSNTFLLECVIQAQFRQIPQPHTLQTRIYNLFID
jgi:hypothetical protein